MPQEVPHSLTERSPSAAHPGSARAVANEFGIFLLLAIAVVLPLLRLLGVISWQWVIVLAPFTVAGAILLVLITVTMLPARVAQLRLRLSGALGENVGGTPPPETLGIHRAPEDHDLRILAQHPELLAALCLGFRMKRLRPAVLGRPVADAWGVYDAALHASPVMLAELQVLARLHVEQYANKGRASLGRRPSDANLMKHAIDHFRRCAEKTLVRGGNPDCPFEHVTVVFGCQSPNRDMHLKSLAPKVRALLEHQYPQLATASLADGSAVKYAEWKEQAALDRREVARLKKELDRVNAALDDNTSQLKAARKENEVMRAGLDRSRSELRDAARAEQGRVVSELRSALDRASLEQNRELARLHKEMEKQGAALAALSQERDELERALFSQHDDEADGDAVDMDVSLVGTRVLLVGGDARQIGSIRDFLESRGLQLQHEDSVNAVQLVASADIVVFWIIYLSHPKYFAVRRECKVRGAPHCYWMRTSPASLLALIAEKRRAEATPVPILTSSTKTAS